MKIKVNFGGGMLGLMFLIFMTLKLCHVINWSWWWVTAPLWGIPALLLAIGAIFLVLFIIGFIFYLIARLFGYKL